MVYRYSLYVYVRYPKLSAGIFPAGYCSTPVVEKDREGTSGGSQDIIPFIKSYVYENFDKDLLLDHLGQVVHLHPAYLSKVFKDETDMNIIKC